MDDDHPISRAWHEMAAWQKASIVITGTMFAPFALFIAFITALSLWPLFLLGRFEGSAPRNTLEHDAMRVLRRQRKRTALYYQAEAGHA